MELDFYNFIVVKPFVYIESHLLGKKAEAEAEAEAQELRPQMQSALTIFYNSKIAAIITQPQTITLAEVESLVEPTAESDVKAVAAKVTTNPNAQALLANWGLAILNTVVETGYNLVTAAISNASHSATTA